MLLFVDKDQSVKKIITPRGVRVVANVPSTQGQSAGAGQNNKEDKESDHQSVPIIDTFRVMVCYDDPIIVDETEQAFLNQNMKSISSEDKLEKKSLPDNIQSSLCV